jgi:hypothetical protein
MKPDLRFLLLHWSERALRIALTAFVSLVALDMFEERAPFFRIMASLAMQRRNFSPAAPPEWIRWKPLRVE